MTLQDADNLRDTGGKGVAEAVKQVQAILARVEAEAHAAREAAERAEQKAEKARSAAEDVKTLKLEERQERTNAGRGLWNAIWHGFGVIKAEGDKLFKS